MRMDHGSSIRKRLSWYFAIALTGLSLPACSDDKGEEDDSSLDDGDGDDTTPDDGGDGDGDDTTPDDGDGDDDCIFREEPAPPDYDWDFSSIPIGSTDLRYFPTPQSVGLVVLFDGGEGSLTWFNRVENRYQVEALVDAGYAVMALESEDPTTGNFDFTDSEMNPDIQNLNAAIAAAAAAGITTSPLYYLGFSSGGVFASFATRHVPADAMALFNVRGDPLTFDGSFGAPPPTMWVVAQNDPLVPPDDPDLAANLSAIATLGIDSRLLPNDAIGMGDGAFTRIADPGSAVSPGDSAALVASLQDNGYLEPCLVPNREASELDLNALSFGPSFTQVFIEEAGRQYDEMYAAHEFTSDFTGDVVTFFAAHP